MELGILASTMETNGHAVKISDDLQNIKSRIHQLEKASKKLL